MGFEVLGLGFEFFGLGFEVLGLGFEVFCFYAPLLVSRRRQQQYVAPSPVTKHMPQQLPKQKLAHPFPMVFFPNRYPMLKNVARSAVR